MNIQKALEEMEKDLSAIKADIEVIKVRLDMLSRVVYGAVSVILLGVLTAGLTLILK